VSSCSRELSTDDLQICETQVQPLVSTLAEEHRGAEVIGRSVQGANLPLSEGRMQYSRAHPQGVTQIVLRIAHEAGFIGELGAWGPRGSFTSR